MSIMDAELKRPSELTSAERGAWQAFRHSNTDLVSPYFALEYADCCEVARTDTRVLVVRQTGEIKGFLPLQKGRFGYARPLSGPLSDVHGVISPAREEFDLQAALKKARIPVFEFHSGLGLQGVWGANATVYDGSWVIDLSEGYSRFVESRTAAEPKAFRNIRARRRKLEEWEGEFEFIIDDRRPEAIAKMIEWKRDQYHRTHVFDVFSVSWTQRLMSQLMERRNQHFAGVCSTLNIDGEIAAVHVGMRSADRLHYWFPAYDPAYNKVSPGLLLLLEIADWAAANGLSSIEMGPGDYDFKKHLGGFQIPLAQGSLSTRSLPSMLRNMTQGVASGIERLPLGRLTELPRKALRKADRLASFYAL